MSVAPQTPPYRTMHEHVLDVLGVEIVSGLPPAGGTIDPEPVLCERLGVSRGALREAVKALAAKGMVELRPRTGTRVLARSNWNLLDRRVLSWLQRTDPDGLMTHLTEMRQLIEPGAAQLAATRALPEQEEELLAAYGAMAEAERRGQPGRFTAADIEFHHILLRMTHNPLLTAVNSSLELALQATFERTSSAPGALQVTLPLHLQVAEAIIAHHPDLARAGMVTLISTSARNFAQVRTSANRPDHEATDSHEAPEAPDAGPPSHT